MNIHTRIKSFFVLLIIFFSVPLLFNSSSVFATESWECNIQNLVLNSAGTGFDSTKSNQTVREKGSMPACTSVDTGELGFKIPSLGDLLTFAIRAFFVIAGLAALFYLLLGALAWVTSGGDKDAVTAAREKIQAAVLGMILIVAVLAIIWTLEQVIFNRRICLGLSCPLTLPGLIESNTRVWMRGLVPTTSTKEANCCVCLNDDGSFGDRINTRFYKCNKGSGVLF